MSFPAYCGSPEVYGRINMRHCNNFHPESLINILQICVSEMIRLLSRDYRTPINSYKSLIKRLQQNITKCWNI